MNNKILKKSFIITTIIFSIISIYYGIEITIAYRKTSKIRHEYLSEDILLIKLNDLSSRQKEILLSVEDPFFYRHHGIDLITPGAGITTITQGLTKYMYFDNFKPGVAKIKQSLIALLVLDKKFNKDEQLQIFINTVYLGDDGVSAVKGFQEASKFYFHKNFFEITEDEYISLITMIIAPANFDYITQVEHHNIRKEKIKNLINGTCKPVNNSDVYYKKC